MKKLFIYIPIVFLSLSLFSEVTTNPNLKENKLKVINCSTNEPRKTLPKWWH